MKNWLIILIVFALPLGVYGILRHNAAAAGMTQFINPMQIQMTVDENNRRNREEANLPKLYVFHSPMCADCKEQAKELKGIKEEFDGRICFLEYSVTGESGGQQTVKNLIKKYGVNVTPTIVVTKANGNVIKKYDSLVKRAELEKLLKNVVVNEADSKGKK